MFNKSPDNDQQLNSLYKQRKAKVKMQPQARDKLNFTIEQASIKAGLGDDARLRDKYPSFSFIKLSLYTAALFAIALPLFSLLLQQVTMINTPASKLVEQRVEFIEHAEDTGTLIAQQTKTSSDLPAFVHKGIPKPSFSRIVANTEQKKLDLFNQQLQGFMDESYQQVNEAHQVMYADKVRKGKLVKQKDMWMIEFCGEQIQQLAVELIEESFLADPLLDETREQSFFDVYSNQKGIIAMLATTPSKQCN